MPNLKPWLAQVPVTLAVFGHNLASDIPEFIPYFVVCFTLNQWDELYNRMLHMSQISQCLTSLNNT